MPLLAWALTGDASNAESISSLARPARVYGYKRFSLHNRDYPAAIEHDPQSSVDGYLLTLDTTSQRRKLDDFEGEIYQPTRVSVEILGPEGEPSEMLEADMYVWNGEPDLVSSESWDLETFVKERLEEWIDLFEGIELVGDD